MIRKTLAPLATLSLLTLTLAAGGCTKGSSPTEPAFSDLESSSAAVVASPAGDTKRHGADDPAGDDRGGRNGGRGADDPAGDDRGGRGGRGGNQRPARGAEFNGVVTSVAGGTLTLAGGTRVIVNGQTQWNSRGDLLSLDRVAAALNAGRRTRVEGRGARQADGTLLAQTIKAETGR
jgi:hypothetical protein